MKKLEIQRNDTRVISSFFLGFAAFLLGCGGASMEESFHSQSAKGAYDFSAGEAASNNDEANSASVPTINRKIIYNAQVELVVGDFSTIETAVPDLVKEHGGYLAQVSIDRASGEHRSGSWQARIPVEQFDSFQDAIAKLGIAERRSQTANDVTEEFVDIKARIVNKKRLEKRIIDLLEKTTGKIAEVIEVERELGRVRGEIEQMEGRLRYLKSRTDLTTVEIIAREQHDYVPPQAPTFITRISQAWGNSLFAIQQFGENVAIAFAFAIPWLITFLVLMTPVFLFRKRRNS